MTLRPHTFLGTEPGAPMLAKLGPYGWIEQKFPANAAGLLAALDAFSAQRAALERELADAEPGETFGLALWLGPTLCECLMSDHVQAVYGGGLEAPEGEAWSDLTPAEPRALGPAKRKP